MNYKISCSFIVDKYSILKIKEVKIKDEKSILNIKNEIHALEDDVDCLTKFVQESPLYKQLIDVNRKLWVLEDLIREKSKEKSFDEKYIKYAESIHETNDMRYQIKRKINLSTNSKYVEEKSYSIDVKNKKNVSTRYK